MAVLLQQRIEIKLLLITLSNKVTPTRNVSTYFERPQSCVFHCPL